MKNVLSIDLEDWHQLIYRRLTGELLPPGFDVVRQVDLLLDLFYKYRVSATFFVLGTIAEHHPQLLRRIANAGHEIACHGYAHLRVYTLSPEQFEQDALRAKSLIEDVVGQPVLGYRAAEFSIRANSLWALQVLAKLGFSYDSSVFPIRHRRYGIPNFHSSPARYNLPNGYEIAELPLSTLAFGNTRIPVAGGGYFRLLPQWLLVAAVRKLNRARRPMVAYFHPYEFDSRYLDIFRVLRPAGWRQRLLGLRCNRLYNLRRRSLLPKVEALLAKFQFTTCQEFLSGAKLAPGRALFSAAGR
jgi:polysaccharide deacetylase family protein (PEP-CTERM system associated)